MITVELFKLAVLATVAFGNILEEVWIVTADSGEVDYRTPNVFNYYTSLSTFQIFPAQRRFLRFRIKTCDAALVLLSAAIDLQSPDFYEVCIGGAENTAVYLRKLGQNVTNYYEQYAFNGYGLLSCEDYRLFELYWGVSSTITLWSETKGIVMSWTDRNIPIDVKGVGLMSAWGSDGTWVVENLSLFNGQYCGANGIYGDMVILTTSMDSSIISCALECALLQNCMGINMNHKIKECQFIARGQPVVWSVDHDWTFYTKCVNENLCVGCII
ncbi:unnamed protein product [Mytilus edulis]|uniref:Farnesoic acid O-methyl transferase domain-containing protein n=1 Tax=Mytilus edulis TaxID=6550 RepID=A0A8S3VQG2_MYTED|nr:unnamed protein product [Mytilus edulis]